MIIKGQRAFARQARATGPEDRLGIIQGGGGTEHEQVSSGRAPHQQALWRTLGQLGSDSVWRGRAEGLPHGPGEQTAGRQPVLRRGRTADRDRIRGKAPNRLPYVHNAQRRVAAPGLAGCPHERGQRRARSADADDE
jgi:hypothetical protein